MRATTFFVTRAFGAAFFLTGTFFATFFAAETLAFGALRPAAFWPTALFAFGRLIFALLARPFTADFDDERRAAARDVERLRPLVTALIAALC